jgi:hypothetical protein
MSKKVEAIKKWLNDHDDEEVTVHFPGGQITGTFRGISDEGFVELSNLNVENPNVHTTGYKPMAYVWIKDISALSY